MVEKHRHIANTKKRWARIATELTANGYAVNSTQAAGQYRNLKSRFYKAKTKAKQSGAAAVSFGYYKECQEHFDRPDNREINPVSACSSLSGSSAGSSQVSQDSDHDLETDADESEDAADVTPPEPRRRRS